MIYLKNQMTFLTILFIIVLGLIIFSGTLISNTAEKQEFTIIEQINHKLGKIEKRKYPKMTLFQISLADDTKQSMNSSFEILADYISKRNEKNEKIRMTTPVIKKMNEQNTWTLSFIAPKQYNIENLPKPLDEKISIVEEKEKTYIAITFSGNMNEDSKNKHLTNLLKYCKDNNLNVNKNPIILMYNPPWTLPLLKKNEILLEIIN